MVFDRRIMQFSEPVTSGEEFRNRSEGAKRGWLKRAREITQNTVGLAGKTLGLTASTLTNLNSVEKTRRIKRILSDTTDFVGREALTGGALTLLLLTKRGRAFTRGALSRTAKGAKGFLKEGFGDVPNKLITQLRNRSPRVDKIATVVEDISPAANPVGKVLKKGYKDVKATGEVIKKAKQEVDEVVEAAKSPDVRKGRKVVGQLELEDIDKINPAAEGASIWQRLAWRGKRDRAQIKAWTGFHKYSDNFWIKFNNRRQKNIEFFNSKSSSYIKFSQRRKPMSEATKRKISKSLARSKGNTAGYDTEASTMPNKGSLIDNGIESIGKLTKAVSPILRYMNERENIAERKKRRQIQAVNTAIYGVGTGSRILSTATSGKLARERLASRQNLLERQLQSREGLERLKADTRVRVETIKDSSRRVSASAYKRQADSQRMKELSRMKIPPQTQTWNDLFNL